MLYKEFRPGSSVSVDRAQATSTPYFASNNRRSKNEATTEVKYLEIWMANIPIRADSHVQCGDRPVVIISNDEINETSPVVSVVPLTTKIRRLWMRSHVPLNGHGLRYPSMVLIEQVTTIDKRQLRFRIGQISTKNDVVEIKKALLNHMGLMA